MHLATLKSVTDAIRNPVIVCCLRHRAAPFSTCQNVAKNDQLPPRPKVPEEETFKRYLKGSGPGGQKINKTSSAVQLTHLPTGIVVKSQATRSRTQNESIARRILAEKVELLEKGADSRTEKKRERTSKKRRSAEKKSRRKYRKLGNREEVQVQGQGDGSTQPWGSMGAADTVLDERDSAKLSE